jgi:3-oxoacyl-[acyl-carrier-protein] synthase I
VEEAMGSGVSSIAYVGATNVISSVGFTTDECFGALERYASGIVPVDDPILYEHPFLAAQVDWQRLGAMAQAAGLDGYTGIEQLMILSIKDVLEQSGVSLASNDAAVIFSSTKGNVELLSHDVEALHEGAYLWKMAQRVASYFNAFNKPQVISNACISGVSAAVIASRLVREGAYKHVVVVGADVLTRFVVSGFSAFKSVSSRPCTPYDAHRDGLTLGEGCATILITSDKRLSCGVVVEGGAITNDANHISGPSRTGDGLCYAIQQAMEENGLTAEDISFVNAHGTATPYNDEMESKAIALAGLSSVPVNSLKPYFGHTLGASGVIETAMCVAMLKHGLVIGTKGFAELGVPEPIVVSGAHQPISRMVRCVKTASGFGGCNGAVVLALEEHAKAIPAKDTNDTAQRIGSCQIADGKVVVDGSVAFEAGGDFAEFIRGAFKHLEAPNMKFYKMDNLCKLGYLAAEYLLKDKKYAPLELGMVLANRSSSLDTDIHHQRILNEHSEAGASPAVFVYTLPNVVLGEICIRHKIQGENTFVINENKSDSSLESYARTVLERSPYKAVIYGWCELLDNDYQAELVIIEKK